MNKDYGLKLQKEFEIEERTSVYEYFDNGESYFNDEYVGWLQEKLINKNDINKKMSELPWWCIAEIIIEHKRNLLIYKIAGFNSKNQTVSFHLRNSEYISLTDINDYKPISGPFSMMPKWATFVHFYEDGSGYFFNDENSFKSLKPEFPIWHDCTEEWKGKTFSLDGLNE